jgi:hypothetical protein
MITSICCLKERSSVRCRDRGEPPYTRVDLAADGGSQVADHRVCCRPIRPSLRGVSTDTLALPAARGC